MYFIEQFSFPVFMLPSFEKLLKISDFFDFFDTVEGYDF